jgi:hypothetical protein
VPQAKEPGPGSERPTEVWVTDEYCQAKVSAARVQRDAACIWNTKVMPERSDLDRVLE